MLDILFGFWCRRFHNLNSTMATTGDSVAPPVPTRHESYQMPTTALRKVYDNLYTDKTNYFRRTLCWEKLWSTTSGDYGSFSNGTKRRHTNQNREDVWRTTGWDTTNEQLGANKQAAMRQCTSPEKVVGTSECGVGSGVDPAMAMAYSRHASGADVLKVDHERPVKSPENKTSRLPSPEKKPTETPACLYPKNPVCQPKAHPKPHPLPMLYSRSVDSMNINNIDKSRPNLTSGYAKQYVRDAQGPFWTNLESFKW